MTDLSFEGRAVLVTGAGSAGYDNLGRSYALEFARRGAMVAVNDLHEEGCQRVVSEIEAEGGRAVGIPASIGTVDGARGVVDAAVEAFGRIDVVVNNAGVLRKGPFEELTPEDLEAVFDVHLRGQVYVAQQAYRHMMKAKYGRIVNISSTAGIFGKENLAAYATAKTAIVGLSNVIAIEGKEHGVNCNIVLPHAVVHRPEGNAATEADKARMAAFRHAIEASGSPDFVTPLVVYLASEACTVTHRIYSANHGWYARVFIGMGEGWFNPSSSPASAEDIAAHLGQIESEDNYTVPMAIQESTQGLVRLLQAHGKV
jgi:NAD(P)-dependent dehydrogenase (short-subunit alcohol dehydrogenase family)